MMIVTGASGSFGRAAAERLLERLHIAYTSVLGAARPDNPALVKLEHRATEEHLKKSGAAWTFLRDSQYAEAIAGAMVPPALMLGGNLTDNCANGRVAFVSREDCVACATEVILQNGHENRAYDITGGERFSIPQAMQIAGEIAGKPIVVKSVDDAGMFAYFESLGVPRHASDVVPKGPIPWSGDDMVTFGQAIREGFFDVQTDNVERLTGRKPRTLRQGMTEFRASCPL